jgi:cell wall-associated NlpC family hydrolase
VRRGSSTAMGVGLGVALSLTVLSPTSQVAAASRPAALPAAANPALVSTGVRHTPDVSALEQKAEALRDRLHQLEARAAWTEERLAYARDQLTAATTSAVTADEQLDTLNGYSTQAGVDLAHRVRAIEQSGGAAALYTQALDADALADVTSNVAALHAVLSTDVVNAADAADARSEMATVYQRLDRAANVQARLTTRVTTLAEQARDLVDRQRQFVKNADDRVARALKAIERREQAQAEAQVTTWTGPVPSGSTPYSGPAVAAALSVLGSPYVWGAEGPTTFDCSGLVQWSYLQAGLVLPRLASDQYRASTPVPYDQMQPGDLIVYAYDVSDESTIHHITMYIGNGQMVHAPRTGDVVKVVPVYTEGIFGTVRPGL